MGASKNTGFTIIEVILFLAISALLAIVLLAGMQTTIERQRYHDNVTTLKSFIQNQYNAALAVVNDRNDGKKCDSASAVILPSGGTSRGMSDCVVLGRYITASDNGVDIQAASVIGFRPPGPKALNDADEVKLYKLASTDKIPEAEWAALEVETYHFGGNDRVVRANTHEALPFKVLVLRSPLSGMVMTYVASGNVTLHQIVQAGPSASAQLLCMASGSTTSGLPLSGKMMGVRINPFTTNQSGIEIPPEKDNVCG